MLEDLLARLRRWLAGPLPADETGQPYLLDAPFGVDLVERQGWRFEVTFTEAVARVEPARIAEFATRLGGLPGITRVKHDGREVWVGTRLSWDRFQELAFRTWEEGAEV